MSEKKLNLFTIGQFAALHGINKKTLMWYDETGIFKPAIIRENGYRYYTYFQSSTLEAILMLRELDVPICKIQDFLKNRSAENLKELLEEQTAELDRRIAHLRSIRKSLVQQTNDTSSLLDLNLSDIRLIEHKTEYLITLHTTGDISWEQDIRTLVGEIQNRNLHNLYNARYGAMIPTASLYEGNMQDYHAVFLNVPIKGSHKELHQKPAGTYLTAYFKGNVNDLSSRYTQLLAHAARHKLELTGYAYETVLNEMVVTSMDDYIMQIEILCAAAQQ